MTLAYADALAEARSCLAALADDATDFDESSHFEHLLLDLDRLHPIGPGLSPTAATKAALGGDGLSPNCSWSAPWTSALIRNESASADSLRS